MNAKEDILKLRLRFNTKRYAIYFALCTLVSLRRSMQTPTNSTAPYFPIEQENNVFNLKQANNNHDTSMTTAPGDTNSTANQNNESDIPWNPEWEVRPTTVCLTTSTKGLNNVHYDTGDEFCITDYWVSDGKTSRDHFLCTATLNGNDCNSCVYFGAMGYCSGGGGVSADETFQLDCHAAKPSYSQVDVCGNSVSIWKSSSSSSGSSGLSGLFGLLFGVLVLAGRIRIRSEIAENAQTRARRQRRERLRGLGQQEYDECDSEIEISNVPNTSHDKGIPTAMATTTTSEIV